MHPSARFYLCARCRLQTFICRACDRGQIYCAAECANAARAKFQREASQRYDRTRRARVLNADRQRRYRLRQRTQDNQKVTDQGSRGVPVRTSSNANLAKGSSDNFRSVGPTPGLIHCHRCGCECTPRVRLGFLDPGHRRQVVVKPPP